ncbi:uncharacterized protein PRCAT00005063001 [Priceomyces carsonii]|uniref:uncharacterized protein n=1 Tax=Priceomyces carsonii TaxID=28549 RepID=UPI002EDAAD9B|nr:unnamed protein product [Priceomyces carsonii]
MSNVREAEELREQAIKEWKNSSKPDSEEGWISRAKEIAKILKVDAVERDRKGQTPFLEIELLKVAGFINLLGPKEYGGSGEKWELTYRIVMEISKADSSIGHLLGNHYSWFWSPFYFGTEEQRRKWIRIFTQENAYIGGAVNPRNRDMIATPENDEIVLNGRKFFSTGSVVADYMILEGVLPDGGHVFAFVSSSHPGLKFLHDWNAIGQRLTESGGVVIENVRVKWDDALGYSSGGIKVVDDPYSSFILPPVQLQFAAVHTGVGYGALDQAADYTRNHTRPWPYGGDNKEKATDEWYIRETYGNLASKLFAAEALIYKTAKSVSYALHDDRTHLNEQIRGEIAVKVAASKVVAAEVALEVTSKIFEITGARSALTTFALDRFWRNVRVHSLHDPLAYKKREVGSFFLLHEIPTPSWYT